MGKTKNILATIILCIFSLGWTSCKQDIDLAKWLIGTWENKTSRGSIYEQWNENSENEFTGRSFMIREADTVVFETISILQEGNSLYYIPTVKNQNNNQPIKFTATTITASKLIFENPEHDFPQMITYEKMGTDSLVAQISGTIEGQERKKTFPMKRVQ